LLNEALAIQITGHTFHHLHPSHIRKSKDDQDGEHLEQVELFIIQQELDESNAEFK
jgi:hypothetical protein